MKRKIQIVIEAEVEDYKGNGTSIKGINHQLYFTPDYIKIREEKIVSHTSIPNVGEKIELIAMPNDPNPIPSGTKGSVESVTNIGHGEYQIGVKWENGRTLMLILPHDKIRIL